MTSAARYVVGVGGCGRFRSYGHWKRYQELELELAHPPSLPIQFLSLFPHYCPLGLGLCANSLPSLLLYLPHLLHASSDSIQSSDISNQIVAKG